MTSKIQLAKQILHVIRGFKIKYEIYADPYLKTELWEMQDNISISKRLLSVESIFEELNQPNDQYDINNIISVMSEFMSEHFIPRTIETRSMLRVRKEEELLTQTSNKIIIERICDETEDIQIIQLDKNTLLDNKINITFINLLKKELDSFCDNKCAICYNTPKKESSLLTSCGHEFCQECYIKWGYDCNKTPSCPVCRKNNPNVIMFKNKTQKIVITEYNVWGQVITKQ